MDILEQRAWLKQLRQRLSSDGYYLCPLRYKTAGSSKNKNVQKAPTNFRRFSPFAFGNDEFNCSPSCLGLSCLLVAIGQLTKAKHFLVTPLDPLGFYKYGIVDQVQKAVSSAPSLKLSREIYYDQQQRKIDSSRKLVEYQLELEQFHPALLIQLKDGCWWVLDPYLGVVGPVAMPGGDADKELERFAELQEVQPGLSTYIQEDVGSNQCLFEVIKKAEAMLDRLSISSGGLVDQCLRTKTASEACAIFRRSDVFRLILHLNEVNWSHVTDYGWDGIARFYLFMENYCGGERFEHDAIYRHNCLANMVAAVYDSLVYSVAATLNNCQTEGRIVHNNYEVSFPVTGLAWRVLSDTAVQLDVMENFSRVLVNQCTGQFAAANFLRFQPDNFELRNLPLCYPVQHPALIAATGRSVFPFKQLLKEYSRAVGTLAQLVSH